MIAETLIDDETWATAPEPPGAAFLHIAEAARKRLEWALSDLNPLKDKFAALEWRRQYVWEVAAVAEALGIGGIYSPSDAQTNPDTMAAFDSQLARALTLIKVEMRDSLRADSVQLAFTTKADIRTRLEELRDKINKSNLSAEQKARLHRRVDAVESELDKSRSGLPPFWQLAGAIACAVSTTADLPDAVKTVQSVVDAVHAEKVAEDQLRIRADPPRLGHEPTLQITDQSEIPPPEAA